MVPVMVGQAMRRIGYLCLLKRIAGEGVGTATTASWANLRPFDPKIQSHRDARVRRRGRRRQSSGTVYGVVDESPELREWDQLCHS